MYNRVECGGLQELFTPISQRSAGRGVFFLRVCKWSPAVGDALWRYHEAARERGAILEGQIANPDERQLGFLHEMLGDSFENSPAFLTAALERWMPRMQPRHRAEFADALHAQLDALKARGKTDSILKNIYIKMMCWLYYKFERLMPALGQDDPPRVLYETRGVTAHELILLRILSAMGADILLLEPSGDAPYLKQDPESAWSQLLQADGADFPQGFTLKQFRKERMAQAVPPRPSAPGQAANSPRPSASAQPGKAQQPSALTLQPTAPQNPAAPMQPGDSVRPTQSAPQNPTAPVQPTSAAQTDAPRRPLTLSLQPSGSRSPITLTLQPTSPAQPGKAQQPITLSLQATKPQSSASAQTSAPRNPAASAQPGNSPRPMVAQSAPTRPAQRSAARDPESYFPQPSHSPCTNAWLKEAAYTGILTPYADRGDALDLFYNAFIRVKGVPDKLSYMRELYQFYQKLKQTGRSIVIVEPRLEMPDPEETEQIRRRPYRTVEELIVDIAGNLPACANVELQKLMQRAFVRTMKYAAAQEPSLNRLLTSAVYLLCWVRRYQAALFQGYRWGENPCFILMGGCRSRHDALFVRYLAQLPVDVLILACDLSQSCTATGDALLELSGMDSMPVPRFPRDAGSLQMQTAASSAQEELIPILYTDSGLYRDRQFSRADAITLRTTCDELFMLWNQELRYRPSFGTVDQLVSMPVLYAKVAGVAKGRAEAYWQRIRQLLGEGTRLVRSFPIIPAGTGNPYQALALKVLRNGRLRREELKAHRQYPFALLRAELQEFILDKLQLMLDRRLIKGTFVNGMEYTIVATVLNLDKDLVRRLQSFDFTRKNPKLVAICTTEQLCSPEDAILLTFLNLVGFDIAIFVPTGYQTIERYLNDNLPVEHQDGDYIYDLQVPDFDALPPLRGRSWLGNLLKRGN